MGIVRAVCTSPAKGTQKTNVKSAEFIEDFGIKEDAHAGKWHRQISLLSYEKIEAFRARGAEVADGAFGENLVVSKVAGHETVDGGRRRCPYRPYPCPAALRPVWIMPQTNTTRRALPLHAGGRGKGGISF